MTIQDLEPAVEPGLNLVQPRPQARAGTDRSMMGQALVERGQGGEAGADANAGRRVIGLRFAREPGGNLPEATRMFVQRPAIERDQRDGDKPQIGRFDEPLMDLFDRRAREPVRRPGSDNEGASAGDVAPEPGPAAAPRVAQGLTRRAGLRDRRILLQDRSRVVADHVACPAVRARGAPVRTPRVPVPGRGGRGSPPSAGA